MIKSNLRGRFLAKYEFTLDGALTTFYVEASTYQEALNEAEKYLEPISKELGLSFNRNKIKFVKLVD